MARTTPETLLISAIVNSGDVHLGASFGIRPEHFGGESYRNIYEWVLNFHSQYGSCPTETELTTAFVNFPHDPDHYDARWAAAEVRRRHAYNDLRDRMVEATAHLRKDQVEDAYAIFEEARYEVAARKPDNALIDHRFMDEYFDSPEKRVELGWPSLQTRTHGIGPGELWYFAARQGQGKSSFLIDIAAQAAMSGENVVVYSLEMTKRQTQVRLHTALGRRLGYKVDAMSMLRRHYDPATYKRLLSDLEEKVPGSIAIHEVSAGVVTPAVIEANAGDFDLSIVDYVGLMRNNENIPAIKDYRVIAEISNSLKQIALGRHHSILAASQINREGVTSSWRPPALHTLAQSDHLGNDGDVVITMKRFGQGASVLSLEKNRHGQSGVNFFTKYDANNGDFSEITRDDAEEIRDSEDDD